jgi:ferric-dicitrate binding protein FerR (iron transport regulator)
MEEEWNQKARMAAEAAAWVDLLRNANDLTRRTFDEWVTRDPRHVAEFLAAKVIANEVRGLHAVRWLEVSRAARSAFE